MGSLGCSPSSGANQLPFSKESFLKTPLLAAEGFIIQMIQIQGEKAERFQLTSRTCLT
jgi:hypothetical protein